MLARGWSWTIILYICLTPKPVVAVKARAEAVANSRACDLRKPSVSELIDTYDHEPFIERATASVLEQDSQVRSEKRAVIPAATQMDGSIRPQTVEKRIHKPYWRLIDDFEKHPGVPILLNTASSGMDALVLSSFLIEK